MKSFKRFMRAALILLLVLGMMIPTAFGAGSESPAPTESQTPSNPGSDDTPPLSTEKCSLKLTLAPGGVKVPNVAYTIYKVADVYPEIAQYKALDPQLAASLKRFSGDGGWGSKVNGVKTYVTSAEYAAANPDNKPITGTTDTNGEVTFTKLDCGIYLVCGSESDWIDGVKYIQADTLLTVPSYVPGEGYSKYTVDSTAKVNTRQRYITVNIKWEDEGYEDNRPQSVTVQLRRKDGTVIHNQSITGDWSYTWTDPYGDLEAWIVTASRDELISKNYDKDTFDEYEKTTGFTAGGDDLTTLTFTLKIVGTEIGGDDPPPTTSIRDLRVLKVWLGDGGDTTLRPDSITVDLLRDGEVYDTVELSSATNWRYDWSKLETKYDWQVLEHVESGSGYAVSVSTDGVTQTITNTFTTDLTDEEPPLTDLDDPDVPLDPGPPDENLDDPDVPYYPGDPDVPYYPGDPDVPYYPGDPDIPMIPASPDDPQVDLPDEDPPLVELPQTGVLWWPVPIMAVLGAALILMGYARRRNAVR